MLPGLELKMLTTTRTSLVLKFDFFRGKRITVEQKEATVLTVLLHSVVTHSTVCYATYSL